MKKDKEKCLVAKCKNQSVSRRICRKHKIHFMKMIESKQLTRELFDSIFHSKRNRGNLEETYLWEKEQLKNKKKK